MAHKEQIEFCKSIRNKFPQRFSDCWVLDIGSLDINGNNRYLFSNPHYIGIDVGEGPNVDVVCLGHEFKSLKKFDVVISTECFEHDKYYDKTIINAVQLLKSGGLFMFTCASTGRAEHGTTKTDTYSSPLSCQLFNDYYKNLTEEDIRQVLNVEEVFSEFEFIYSAAYHDLYFYGIKK